MHHARAGPYRGLSVSRACNPVQRISVRDRAIRFDRNATNASGPIWHTRSPLDGMTRLRGLGTGSTRRSDPVRRRRRGRSGKPRCCGRFRVSRSCWTESRVGSSGHAMRVCQGDTGGSVDLGVLSNGDGLRYGRLRNSISFVSRNLAAPEPVGISRQTLRFSGVLLRNTCPSPPGGAGAALLRTDLVTALQMATYAVEALPDPSGHGTCPTAWHQVSRVRCLPTLTTRELHRTYTGRVEPAVRVCSLIPPLAAQPRMVTMGAATTPVLFKHGRAVIGWIRAGAAEIHWILRLTRDAVHRPGQERLCN
jgi:hypothetical protein